LTAAAKSQAPAFLERGAFLLAIAKQSG